MPTIDWPTARDAGHVSTIEELRQMNVQLSTFRGYWSGKG